MRQEAIGASRLAAVSRASMAAAADAQRVEPVATAAPRLGLSGADPAGLDAPVRDRDIGNIT